MIKELQFGFPKDKGFKDAIGLMRIKSEKVFDVQEEMCLHFIEWQKAFHHVNWTKLLEILKILELIGWNVDLITIYTWNKE